MKYLQEYKKFYAWLDKDENSGLWVLFAIGGAITGMAIFVAVMLFLITTAPILIPPLAIAVFFGIPVLAYKYRSKE